MVYPLRNMNLTNLKLRKPDTPEKREKPFKDWTIFSIPILLFFLSGDLIGCAGDKGYMLSKEKLASLSQKIEEFQSIPVENHPVEVVSEYEEFLNRYGEIDRKMKAQALKRLGDLYLERADQQFLEEMESYEKNPKGPPPQKNTRKAIETYQELLSFSPTYKENDDVLYSLSRAYMEAGERDHGIALLEKLINQYPQSTHRLEAYFRLGEYYFDHRHYGKAALAYEQTLQWKDPFFYDKAQYKLGWTYFILEKYQKSVDTFLALVDQKTLNPKEFTPEKGSLVWEALTYVAASFRNLGGSLTVSDYFTHHGPRNYEKDLYLMIGNQYMSTGSRAKGIETYRTFVEKYPLHPMSPLFTSYILDTHIKYKEKKEAKQIRIELVKKYSSQSSWFKANEEKAQILARKLVKKELHYLAVTAHAKAQKEKRIQDYRQAVKWYRLYIGEFPPGQETQEAHFLLAESLMALKEFIQAGTAYEVAAYGYSKTQVDQKSAYNAIVAYEKMKTPNGDEKVVELSKRFAGHFPKDPRTPSILLNAGEILFDDQQYEDTRSVLEVILTQYPNLKSSQKAQKLVAHSYLQEGNFSEAAIAYRKALHGTPPSHKKEKKEITELLASSIYKSAEQYKNNGKIETAAKRLLQITTEAPQSDLAPEGLFEAGTLFQSIAMSSEALSAYQILVRQFPDSTLLGKTQIQLGILFEKEGKEIASARAYEAASQNVKDKELVSNLLWKAGLQYEEAEKWENVYSVYSKFTHRFPKHPDLGEATFKMAEARNKKGKRKEAMTLYQKVTKVSPKTPFAAKANLQLGEDAFKNYKVIELKEPLKKNFKKKTRALERVVTLYTQAIETRFSEVVAVSAHRLGEAFEHYQESLLTSEDPKNLNEEQLAEYHFLLEEKAFPFEEKAIQAYQSNMQRLQEDPNFYNQWIKKSLQRLAELRPSLYKRPERQELIVSKINPKSTPADQPQKNKTQMVKVEP